MKLLLLDLDGTVRQIQSGKSGKTFIDQKIMDGVAEAFLRYPKWIKIGITNQGGFASEFKSIEDAIAEQKRTLELIDLEAILFCADMRGETCWVVEQEANQPYCIIMPGSNFRKPAPGMIHFAGRLAWGWGGKMASNSIDDRLYVGDQEEDEQMAIAAGISFMWADKWRNQ